MNWTLQTTMLLFVISIVAASPGIGAFLLLRKLRPEKKTALRCMKISIIVQFAVSIASVVIQAQPDPPDAENYAGVFLLVISFLVFALFHIGILGVSTWNAKKA
jgi:hypothetical protein